MEIENDIVWFSTKKEGYGRHSTASDFTISICSRTHNKFLIKFNEKWSEIFCGNKIQFAINKGKLLIRISDKGLTVQKMYGRNKVSRSYLRKDKSNERLLKYLGSYKLNYDSKLNIYYAEQEV